MSWLTGWSYRKNHIINPASGAGQNYQKRIVVHFGAGVDSDENVYLNGKCRSDFGDIRFTNIGGAFLLDYWIEKKVDSNYAIFWIEIINDLSVYDAKIYIYYGKVGATSVANGDATFIFFDDFETDLSKWNLFGTPLPSLSTDYAYTGIKSVKLPIYSDMSHLQLPYDNIAVHAHFYDEMLPVFEYTVISIDAGELEVSFIGLINDIAQYEYQLQGIAYNSGVDRTVGWHEFITRSSMGLKQFIIDGNIMPVTGIGTWNPRTFIFTAGTTQAVAYWDLVFWTKFVNPEPTHGSWGAEDDGAGVAAFEAEDVIDEFSGEPLYLEDTVYSLAQKPMNIEDILVSLSLLPLHIPALLSEDVIFALSETRRTVEDLIKVLLFSTLHTAPFSSEEVISALRALRTYDVISEIPSGVTRGFPVIGSLA